MTTPTMSVPAQESQATFRTILDVMSRPGTLGALPTPRADDGRWGGALLVLQALLDHEVSFHVLGADLLPSEQLLRRTGARSAPLYLADFVLAEAGAGIAAIESAKDGPFEEPERSATVVLVVDALSSDAANGGTTLDLRGPGIRTSTQLWIGTDTAELFEALASRNAMFPHGLDVLLVTPTGIVAALPRSTRIAVTNGTPAREA